MKKQLRRAARATALPPRALETVRGGVIETIAFKKLDAKDGKSVMDVTVPPAP